jgi:hypothetical protein
MLSAVRSILHHYHERISNVIDVVTLLICLAELIAQAWNRNFPDEVMKGFHYSVSIYVSVRGLLAIRRNLIARHGRAPYR